MITRDYFLKIWCSLIKEKLADFRIDLLSFLNNLEGQKSSVYSVSSSEFFLSLYEVKAFKTLLMYHLAVLENQVYTALYLTNTSRLFYRALWGENK